MTTSQTATLQVTSFGELTIAAVQNGNRYGITLLRGEDILLHTASPQICPLSDLPLLTRRSGEVFYALTSVDGCQGEEYGSGVYLQGGELHVFTWEDEPCFLRPVTADPVMQPILQAEINKAFGF